MFCNVTVNLTVDLRPTNANKFTLESNWMFEQCLKTFLKAFLRYHIHDNGTGRGTDKLKFDASGYTYRQQRGIKILSLLQCPA